MTDSLPQYQAEARAAELELLRIFAETLNQADTLGEVLQSGLETSVVLLNANAGWIILADEFGSVSLAASFNPLVDIPDIYTQEYPACECLKQLLAGELTKPIKLPECSLLANLQPGKDNPGHISIPLYIKNRAIGILNLVTAPDHTLLEEEQRLLTIIGDQFSVAIERVRLMAETQEGLRREQRITEVTLTISSALDLGIILRNIVDLSVELVGADTGGLGLLVPDSEKIVSPYYLYNSSPKIAALHSLPMGETLAREIIESGKTVFMAANNSSPNAAQPITSPELIARKVLGVIGVPIVVGENNLGALLLYNLNPTRRFSERYLNLVDAIGRQAGVAIQNSRLYEEIQQLASTDPLTGLYNRRHFFNLAMQESAMANRFNQPMAVIMADVDNFKQVNDTYGHIIGDAVLQSVAARCNESVRQSDILGRYGGEEFIILMVGANRETALNVAERLRQRVQDTPITAEDKRIAITVSLGVAAIDPSMHPFPTDGLDVLIKRADQALYKSKEAGKNRVTVWESP